MHNTHMHACVCVCARVHVRVRVRVLVRLRACVRACPWMSPVDLLKSALCAQAREKVRVCQRPPATDQQGQARG